MSEKIIDRLKAMAEDDGQWDLSVKDVAAIRWAISRSEATDRLKHACESLLCAQRGWSDNALQLTYASEVAKAAIAYADHLAEGGCFS